MLKRAKWNLLERCIFLFSLVSVSFFLFIIMKIRHLLLISPLLFFVISCGESYSKIADRNQQGLAKLQADMLAAAEAIPREPTNLELAKPMDPLPKFVKSKLAESNTLITVLEQLKDPNAEIDKEKGLNLYCNDVKNLYIWAKWDQKALEGYEDELKAAFALRYFVIYQTLLFKPAKMVDAKNYDRGGVVLAVHVYDREAGKILATFPVTAQAAEKVSFTYKEGSSKMTAGLRHANSTMWSMAGDKMFELLEEKTGGTFQHK